MSSMKVDMYWSGFTDVASEWRREELSRVRLQKSQIYGDLCLCYVRDIYREPSFSVVSSAFSLVVRDGQLPILSSLANVCIPLPLHIRTPC